jgi:RNA polymerase sigma factor (sigma-70 family)
MYTGVLTLVIEKDQDIIREYVEGNREAGANAFVRKYRNFVFSAALRYLRYFDDADDASQEVFIKALKNVHKFRGESSMETWLYRITMNVCSNYTRRKKARNMFSSTNNIERDYGDFPDSGLTPEQRFENKEFEDSFMEILSKLPEKQRETFALRYFDDLSYEDISKMLGTSVGGLKANYFQAVKKLAEFLKNSE